MSDDTDKSQILAKHANTEIVEAGLTVKGVHPAFNDLSILITM